MNRRDLLKATGAAALGAGIASTASAHPTGVAMLNAVWVHGTSFDVEDAPNMLNGTVRFGWGTNFLGKPGKFAWFHVSIPTPVILDDVRPALEKVFVFYKTTGATIKSVHVYDGPKKIRSFDGLSLSGDRSGGIVPGNSWAITPAATILFGLGLSIGVQFSVGIDSPIKTEMLFTTAGADFRLKR